MNLLSEREQVRGVSARWQAQYRNYHSNPQDEAEKRAIGARLAALNVEKATAKDVLGIVGNASWVGPAACDECGHKSWSSVVLGEPPDYESHTATICLRCLRKAVKLAMKGRA